MEEVAKSSNLASVDIAIKPEMMWLFLVIVIAVFLIFSIILVYHWHKFGMRALAVGTAELIFFVGAFLLVLGASASIALF